MSLRIPGLPPPAPATQRRPEETRARPESSDSRGTDGPRPAAPEVVTDVWIPQPFVAGTGVALPPSPAPSSAPAEPWDGQEPGPPTEAAAGVAAETIRQALQAKPPQAYGVHGNLVTANVLNLLA